MRLRPLFGFSMLAGTSLFGAAAHAQNCSLKLQASVDMLMPDGERPMVPVTINGVPKLMLLDTGGFTTQLARRTVEQLGIRRHEGETELRNASGNISREHVLVKSFTLGQLTALDRDLMVSPSDLEVADGLLSSDMMLAYDVEMDFGAKKLNYFSPDHCPGKVVYWEAPAVAEIPFTLRGNSQIHITIELDGKPFDALVDTGATRSVISLPAASGVFGLTPEAPGVGLAGNVNGDPKLASYRYTFSALTFEGISVNRPTFLLVPDRVGARDAQTGTRTLGNPNIRLPTLILGMDILRHLHLYLSVKDKKMYVSAASRPAPPPAMAPGAVATGQSPVLDKLDNDLRLSPANASLLNARCYGRGMEMVKLDEALADCEASLKVRPDDAPTLDSKGLVLYRLGRYQEAVDIFNAALKLSPKLVPSLYIRGQAKRKLGDAAGAAADIAAAKALNPELVARFRNFGITE